MDLTDSIVNYRRYLKRRNLSPHTVKNYLHTLKQFVLWLDVPIEKVDHRKVLEYIDQLLDRRLIAKTINCHLNSIRRFYDYLNHEEEIRMVNPVKSDYMLKLPQPLPRALKEEEIEMLLKVVRGRRDRAMFMLMLRCGLRVEEVSNLTVDEIDLNRQRLLVKNGKGKKDRVVYISDDARDALGSYLKLRHGKTDKSVFLVEKGSFKGKGISVRGIQKRMEYYARLSKVKVSCHHMRHTMATQMLNAGAELETIQDLLGHNWITTTQRYCKISNLKVRRDYFKAMEMIAQRDRRRAQIEQRPVL